MISSGYCLLHEFLTIGEFMLPTPGSCFLINLNNNRTLAVALKRASRTGEKGQLGIGPDIEANTMPILD